MLPNTQAIILKLRELQRHIRDVIITSRSSANLNAVHRASSADTIYQLDTLVEPVIEEFCEHWSQSLPMVVIAEGLEPETGRVFPAGSSESNAIVRIILDPIDGTRGLMYDKRAAWSLAGAAPNKGASTRLSDIEVAVMTELPTSRMSHADDLWAVKNQGARCIRTNLRTGDSGPIPLHPSTADNIDHGFATISNFFPGTKVLAAELMEFLVSQLIGPADVTRATVFDDQYISTGGQFYELIVGHDRFIADLRSIFYKIQNQPEGLCVHPYDACTQLIALEAGVIITNGQGAPLDGPLDCTTGLSWAGYANKSLRDRIEPIIVKFLNSRQSQSPGG